SSRRANARAEARIRLVQLKRPIGRISIGERRKDALRAVHVEIELRLTHPAVNADECRRSYVEAEHGRCCSLDSPIRILRRHVAHDGRETGLAFIEVERSADQTDRAIRQGATLLFPGVVARCVELQDAGTWVE